MSGYIHLEYPKWVYSIEYPAGLLLNSESELEELDGVFYESPADVQPEKRKK
jgi:hypothetical protein